jgi:hypothetical protein
MLLLLLPLLRNATRTGECVRNCTLDSKPVQFRTGWTVPKRGLLCLDYVAPRHQGSLPGSVPMDHTVSSSTYSCEIQNKAVFALE